MYVSPNYRTKKALKEAVEKGEPVTLFAPGLGRAATEGWDTAEGPHYPAAHTWYAKVRMENGLVKEVI
jgi:hypothetical protein